MTESERVSAAARFTNPRWTASGARRAWVTPAGLRTIWFNTGTVCNISCRGCYIESTPANDRLAYLTRDEVRLFLDEGKRDHPDLQEVGFTGGEPFINPDIVDIIGDALAAGYSALILTNAMKPMWRHSSALLKLNRQFGKRLSIRVSLDHYRQNKHERIRGPQTWVPTLQGLHWLADNEFDIAVAARKLWDEEETAMREGFAALFSKESIPIDVFDPHRLVLFPEMDEPQNVPEITEACWAILGKLPDQVMCAHSRMVVKRKGAKGPVVVSCTLHPYDERFEMGESLAAANRPVSLNHSRCAKFCVLGGANCSA